MKLAMRKLVLRKWLLQGLCLLAVLSCSALNMATAAAPRALSPGEKPADARLAELKDLDGYFPFAPSADAEAWQRRAEYVRTQILVANGLWPMPERTPLEPVIHSPVTREGYTVERVYFQSYPGFHVTGSLYRPTGKQGPFPVVLCPHGHWANGRFHDWGPQEVRNQIAKGAERFEVGGRHPLQARCVQLARMGCIVFHYDMVGYADSQQISFEVAHRFAKQRPEMSKPEAWGFFSPQAELRLQSIMGLQTYNSIRALDFVLQLPDVDKDRVGVTGASGGGTQTFMLGAIDPRVSVAFPAVMVSTAMQGGCTCENCSYLRVGTGNIEFAALFAPKPLGMTAADDWTKEIATKGLPELQKHYELLGAKDLVMAKSLLHFEHNYNAVSRTVMYGWMNKHLKLGLAEPIIEQDYVPLSIEELTVYDAQHPRPAGGDDFERKLTSTIQELSEQKLTALKKDGAAHQKTLRQAWNVLIGRELPASGSIEWEKTVENDRGDYLEFAGLLKNAAAKEATPAIFLQPKQWNGQVTIWAHEQGKSGLYDTSGAPIAEVQKLLKGGAAVAGLDLFLQGEFLAEGQSSSTSRKVKNPREFLGYTAGYNHPLFAQRVHDLLTMISYVRNHPEQPKRVDLVGLGQAGAWAAAAAAQAGAAIDRLAIDGRFRFANVQAIDDANLLPGAVKYGDLPGLIALAADGRKVLVLEQPSQNPGAEVVAWLQK